MWESKFKRMYAQALEAENERLHRRLDAIYDALSLD